jgi:hypothetical protein
VVVTPFTGTTQHQAPVAGIAWLAALHFGTGTLRFTTAPVTVAAGGHDWLGAGGLVSISPVAESEEVVADAVTLSLSIVDTALIAAALGSVENYRGRRVVLLAQLFNEAFVPVGEARQRWVGLMDRIEITRSAGEDGGGGGAAPGDPTGSINLRCSRTGIARMRNAQGLRMTHEQQLRRFPGDTGLRYVRALIERPALWLSKRFQER